MRIGSWHVAVGACLVSVTMPAAALADEPQPQAATQYARVAPVLPTAQISASTSGSASVKAAADIVAGLGDYDLAFTPTVLSTTQDGVGNLFALQNGTPSASTQWQAGLGVAQRRCIATWVTLEARRGGA